MSCLITRPSATPASSAAGFQGGARGGGVSNLGTLTVNDCQFINNQARGADGSLVAFVAGFGGGGAIATGIAAAVPPASTIVCSLTTWPRAAASDSGPFAGLGYGGAIVNSSILNVTDSTFRHNQALGGNNNSGLRRHRRGRRWGHREWPRHSHQPAVGDGQREYLRSQSGRRWQRQYGHNL